MRYVIKKQNKGYYTEMVVKSSRGVTLNGLVIAVETLYEPIFMAFLPAQAAHYDTEADAQSAMTGNPAHYGGPEAFADCGVEPTET